MRVMTARRSGLWLGLAASLLAASAAAWAEGGIYVCIDAQGRRISSDRPIDACRDRPQRELTSTGATRRVIEPDASAAEKAAAEARMQAQEEEEQRALDQDRADRALLARYPTEDSHESARRSALEQPREVLELAQRHLAELEQERAELAAELASFAHDPAQAPARLRAAMKLNSNAIGAQQRVVANQLGEITRTNARFDVEAVRLTEIRRVMAARLRAAEPAPAN